MYRSRFTLNCLVGLGAALAFGLVHGQSTSFVEAAGTSLPPAPTAAPPAPSGGTGVITVYTDRTVFQTAFPGLPLEDFEGGNAPPGGFTVCDAPLSAAGDAACGFDPGEIIAGVAFQDNPGPAVGSLILLGAGTSLNASQVLIANTFNDSFDILFDPPVLAAGMDLHSTPAPGQGPPDILAIQVFDTSDVLIDTDADAAASGPGNFWGVSSAIPIGRISLLSTNNQAEGVDNIEFIGQAADLAATLVDVPDPVAAGADLTYTATLSNAGPSDAVDASLTLTLPAATTFVSATPSAGGICNAASPVACTWAGATGLADVRSVDVVATVDPAQTAALSANVVAASLTFDPVSGNDTATADTAVSVEADLSMSLTDAPDPVLPGNNLTYVATLTNLGPSVAQDAAFSLPLPAGTTFVSVTPSAGATCNAASPVTCSWAGATTTTDVRSASIVASVDPGASGMLAATATASSTSNDPVAGNDTASANTTISDTTDLALSLTDAPDPATAGTTVTYVATVDNGSAIAATGVVVTLTLPPGTSLQSGSVEGGGACAGAPVVCTFTGTIAAGDSRAATIILAIAPSVTAGTILNASATLASTSIDPVPGNNTAATTTTVNASADLLVTLTSSQPRADAGVPVTLTLSGLNQGPSDAQNVVLDATLTAPLGYTSHVASAGGVCTVPAAAAAGTVSCTWAGPTAPGVTRNVQIVATATFSGASSVSATGSSAVPDPQPGNNAAGLALGAASSPLIVPASNIFGLTLIGLLLGLVGLLALRRDR